MHGYERIGNSVLSRDGANLSAVLYALSVGDEAERESLARLLSQIRQLPDEPYDDFNFTTTDLGDVIFGLRERTVTLWMPDHCQMAPCERSLF